MSLQAILSSTCVPALEVGHGICSWCRIVLLDPDYLPSLLHTYTHVPLGKTTHIATRMEDQGMIIALDRSKQKLSRLEEAIARFGLQSIHPFLVDATKTDAVQQILRIHLKDPSFNQHGSFDRVLVDPPCSGLGQRPVFMLPEINESQLDSFGQYQRKLLLQGLRHLKPGGRLVYSTCTLNPGENERVVGWALEALPRQISLVPFPWSAESPSTNLPSAPSHHSTDPNLGGPGLPDVGLDTAFLSHVRRFTPSSQCDTIGFFIAIFTKHTAIP